MAEERPVQVISEEKAKQILDEMAATNMRLDSVDGWLDNLNTTLNNHMTEYNDKLDEVKACAKNAESAVDKVKNADTLRLWVAGVTLAMSLASLSAVVATLLFLIKLVGGM